MQIIILLKHFVRSGFIRPVEDSLQALGYHGYYKSAVAATQFWSGGSSLTEVYFGIGRTDVTASRGPDYRY